MAERREFDPDAYLALVRERPCFICGLVSGDPAFAHPVVYEEEFAVVFLNKYPTLPGYLLVCPKAHREEVTSDFALDEYLRLQAIVFAASEALRAVLEVERVYILSLGNQQANAHVHWHVAALPPGTPFEHQQFGALDAERAGVLALEPAEAQELATRLAGAMRVSPP